MLKLILRLLHEQYGLKEDQAAYLGVSGQSEEAQKTKCSLGGLVNSEAQQAARQAALTAMHIKKDAKNYEAQSRGGLANTTAQQAGRAKGGRANQDPKITPFLLHKSTWVHTKTGKEVSINPYKKQDPVLIETLVALVAKFNKGVPESIKMSDSGNLGRVIKKEGRKSCSGWHLSNKKAPNL